MVTIDVPSCMALGAAVALQRPADDPWKARFRTLGVTLFGFTPLAHLFELYFRDWEWQYPTESIPPFLSMLFIIVMNGLGLVAFEVGRRFMVAGNKRAALYWFLGIFASTGLYCLVAFRRVFWVGTYAEWTSGNAQFMLSRMDFMTLLVGTGTYLAVSIYFWIFYGKSRA